MEYPLKIEIDVVQDDFLQVEMLEQYLDSEIERKDALKTFRKQILVLVVISICFFIFPDTIAMESQFLLLGFGILFTVNFVYRYFYGYKNELRLGLNHLLLSNSRGDTFFTPEKGVVFFYSDRCEYLTNEQRRYFSYDKIGHIKITKHLFIFVMKESKEKNMRGFLYMVIPKRNLDECQTENLNQICKEIKGTFKLSQWIGQTVLD
ncbi:MAG: hypothetical protein RR198_03390 [Oscillospiraceae bacterium]